MNEQNLVGTQMGLGPPGEGFALVVIQRRTVMCSHFQPGKVTLPSSELKGRLDPVKYEYKPKA